jgi:hypothetical protein
MLPPDFDERKLAAQRKSERFRILSRLRECGVDPDSFPHRFFSPEEEETFLATEQPGMRRDCTRVETVADWAEVIERITAWAESRPEVAIWYDARPGNGGLVLPGKLLARELDAVVAAVHQRGNAMLATPDCRAGCVYFEDEYENHFAAWGQS